MQRARQRRAPPPAIARGVVLLEEIAAFAKAADDIDLLAHRRRGDFGARRRHWRFHGPAPGILRRGAAPLRNSDDKKESGAPHAGHSDIYNTPIFRFVKIADDDALS